MTWTLVPKPVESSVVVISTDAQPFGLLIAITSVFSSNTTSVTSGWTDVAKPTSSTWTIIAKPTT